MATQPQPPPLARTLRTALLARQPRIDPSGLPPALFVETVAACDAADRRYRDAIERALAPRDARELLATASAFRGRVRELRATTGAEIDALFARAGRSPVAIDPLDLTTPRVSGLSHVDLVRLADLADRARANVARLRAQANDRIAPLLDAAARDALVAAKQARGVAFAGAVHAELTPFGATIERFSGTVEALATLADGWY
ncbi:MAG: hypothetical protein NVSMB19_15490 [Vulcanimicrobiaceae bacterium]